MFQIRIITARLAGAAALIGISASSWAQADCERLLDPLNAALVQPELRAIVAAAQPILIAAECPAATRKEVAVEAALAHVREANNIKEPARQLAMLETGMTFAQPWKMMKLIGDLRRKAPHSTGSIDHAASSCRLIKPRLQTSPINKASPIRRQRKSFRN